MSHEENDHERMSREQLRAALQSLPRMNAPEELEHRLLSTIATRSRFTPAVLAKGLACAGISALLVAFGWELVTFDGPGDWRPKAAAQATRVVEAEVTPSAPVAAPEAGSPSEAAPAAVETPAPRAIATSRLSPARSTAPKESRVAPLRAGHDTELTGAAAPVDRRDTLPAGAKLPITTPAVAPPSQPLLDSTRTGDGGSPGFDRNAATPVPTPRDSGLTGGH